MKFDPYPREGVVFTGTDAGKHVIVKNWIKAVDITTACQYTAESVTKEMQLGL